MSALNYLDFLLRCCHAVRFDIVTFLSSKAEFLNLWDYFTTAAVVLPVCSFNPSLLLFCIYFLFGRSSPPSSIFKARDKSVTLQSWQILSLEV